MFLLCPIVLILGRNRYEHSPPKGSVVADALKVIRIACKGHWTWNLKKMGRTVEWDKARPSVVMANSAGDRPAWLKWDDAFVDETRRALNACAVFLFFPLYWLSYNQLNNNLTSQAATMTTNGVPNDVINNLDPFALIIGVRIQPLRSWRSKLTAPSNRFPWLTMSSTLLSAAPASTSARSSVSSLDSWPLPLP